MKYVKTHNDYYEVHEDLFRCTKLSMSEKWLLLFLLSAWELRHYRPFQYQLSDLSENSHMSISTVRRAKDGLVEKGIVSQTYKKRENGAPGKCTLYSINESVLDFVLGGGEPLSTEDKILQSLKEHYGKLVCGDYKGLPEYLRAVGDECGSSNDTDFMKLIVKIFNEKADDIKN